MGCWICVEPKTQVIKHKDGNEYVLCDKHADQFLEDANYSKSANKSKSKLTALDN